MNHETIHPFGESDCDRLINEVLRRTASRRTFLKGSALVGASTLFAGITAETLFDIFPSISKNLVLSPAEEHYLYTQLIDKKTGMGWYIDFDTKGDAAFDDLAELSSSPESSQVGIFALLEEFYQPAVMETHVRRLRYIKSLGYVPQISLGVGSYFKPHPFDTHNVHEQVHLMKRWVDYLIMHTAGEINIRFLFEVNAYAGNIAYKKPTNMTEETHQDRFKSLYEEFATIINKNLEAKSRFHLDLSFAASGRGIQEYFPQARVRAVGVDVYPEPYGRLAILSLYDWLFEKKQSSFLQNKILIELLTQTKSYYGSDTKAVLHEIGTTDDHLDWFKSALLLFLAANGEEILYFGYDKTASEKMNYTLNAKKREILRSVHL